VQSAMFMGFYKCDRMAACYKEEVSKTVQRFLDEVKRNAKIYSYVLHSAWMQSWEIVSYN